MKLLLLTVSAIVVFNVNSHGFAGGHKGRHSLKRGPVPDSPNLPQNLKKLLNDGPSSDNIIRQTWELKKTPLFVPHGTQDQELPDEIAQQIEKEYLKIASNNGSYLEESKGQTKTIRQHAPCREGFNRIGSKCYKMYTDTGRSWQNAKSWCEAEGLVMAGKPDDDITFRPALIEIYGESRVWLDARGDNTQFRWGRNNEAISNTDALWYPSSPGSSVTTRDCLLFLFTDYSQKHPFFSWTCNYPEFTICEYSEPCVCGKVNRVKKIVGGKDTEENEYPWQVALVRPGSTNVYCGGSLINDRWVLTAAHCTQRGVTEVLLGNHFQSHIDSTEIRVKIAKVVDHPSYNNPGRLENDFALLELVTPLHLEAVAPHIRPVCLPNAFNPSQYENVNAVTTGWGYTSSSAPGAEILQEVTVRTMTNSECHNVVGASIRSSMICATAPGVGVCYGDSGGPLVRDVGGYFNLIGVTSWVSNRCAGPNFLSGYGRVTDAIDWIKSTSSSGNTCAPPN